MLYYRTKSEENLASLAAILADGKKDFVLWRLDVAHYYTKDGQPAGIEERKQHADAVETWLAMDEKTRKAAHQRAAMRETVRTKEERAAAILAAGVENLSRDDMAELLALVNVAYHSSGKIEGCASVDGCAACKFCQSMIAAAKNNPLMICGSCYAAADSYKEAAWRTHQLNARILSEVLFEKEELAALEIGSDLCRFNEDGDTVNVSHARNLLRIAKVNPGVSFGYWYKNKPAVEAGLIAEGHTSRDKLPGNIRFIHSSVLIGIPAAPAWFDDGIFTVYPDDVTTRAAILAGAHECNGRRCRECGYTCYLMQRRQAGPVYIAEYLRAGKAQRAAILEAYAAIPEDRKTAPRA